MLQSYQALKLSNTKALQLLTSKALKHQSYHGLKLQTYIKIKTCTDLDVAHAPPLTSSLPRAWRPKKGQKRRLRLAYLVPKPQKSL